ncbi:MAG: Crp/Fnr family transcriptional regulator [Bacillota bacterium]
MKRLNCFGAKQLKSKINKQEGDSLKDIGCGCQHCQNKLCTRRVPIFSVLDDEDINRITSLIIRRSYQKGELIVVEGEYPEGLIVINQGKVKAYRNTIEGKEQILYIFSEGDFLGEKDLFKNQQTTYNIEALEDTNICMVTKIDFHRLLREYPDISLKLLEELSDRLDRMEKTIESMGAKNVEARVSAVLLEFAQKYGKQHPKGIMVKLPLSREGIANYIGLTRETVSRKMNILQDEGIIEMIGNKNIVIIDEEALREAAE